jgi:hypothetical protein
MLPREILIWRNWLKGNEPRFDRYEYNLRLGSGVDPGTGYSLEARQSAILNSRRRLDVIAFNLGRATIIEVEENPGLSAYGQLLGYETLWRQYVQQGGPSDLDKNMDLARFYPADLPLDPDPKLLMVCARINADARLVLERGAIAVEVIPTDFSELRAQR